MLEHLAMRRLLLPLVLVFCGCSSLAQSDECRRYLACAEAVAPGSAASYQSSYGEQGSCWSTDLRSADQCTAACANGRQTLAAAFGQGKAECE